MRILFVVVALLLPGAAVAQQSNPQFLAHYRSNAYGRGINSDATGRPTVARRVLPDLAGTETAQPARRIPLA